MLCRDCRYEDHAADEIPCKTCVTDLCIGKRVRFQNFKIKDQEGAVNEVH
jgi:hypothetical protein